MQLTWQPTDFGVFGTGFELTGLPAGAVAHARRHGSGKGFVALASFGPAFLSHNARTVASAMKRLEREIAKRSIGLLGVDDVTFSKEA